MKPPTVPAALLRLRAEAEDSSFLAEQAVIQPDPPITIGSPEPHRVRGLIPRDLWQNAEPMELDGPPDRPLQRSVTLSNVVPEEVRWLWPGRLPAGKLTTLDGDPGVGKSTVAVDIAARITRGRPWPDGPPCARGDVLMLSGEDGLADTVRPRLDAAGGDPSRMHVLRGVVTYTDEGPVERDPHLGDIPAIEDAIRAHRARLLIVDVLMGFLPSGVDSHKDQDIRGVLRRLSDLAERTGCAILLLRHLNKSPGGSALYRGGGSIGIVGAARAGLLAGRDPDDPHLIVLAQVKSNLAPESPSLAYRIVDHRGTGKVAWEEGISNRTPADLLVTRTDEDDKEERDALAAFLTGYIADCGGDASAKDVAAAVHQAFGPIAKATMFRARKRAGISTSRVGFGQGSRMVWTLDMPLPRPSGETS